MSEIICSFIKRCENYKKCCDTCRWNSATKFADCLKLKTEEGKTIRFL